MPTRRLFLELVAAQIDKAMRSLRDAVPKAEADPARPVYHFHPPANWNNDPNGTIYYKSWHHLFYQLNPYGSQWGHMHWGHARSRDMVNWEHLPIAIAPSHDKGEEHIFSGAAIVAKDGKPRVFYTSIGHAQPEQWMAMPLDDDLIRWEKYAGNPAVSVKHHGSTKVEDWRDPFLFHEAGRTYMVCGGNLNKRAAGGSGVVLLYRAENDALTDWKYLGILFEYKNREVINIECPNLFKLDGKWVLLMSPHRPCEYFVGEIDWKRNKFVPETQGVLDPGTSYATNISHDDKGRTILWIWGRTETAADKGWNGVMVLPRLLSVGGDGFLRQQPAPELEQLRGEAGSSLEHDCMEIAVTFSGSGSGKAGLRLKGSTINYDFGSGVLAVNGAKTLIGQAQKLDLRVFVDRGVVDVFANDGAAAVFAPLKLAGGAGSQSFVEGKNVKLDSLRTWPMKAAKFSMDRFTV